MVFGSGSSPDSYFHSLVRSTFAMSTSKQLVVSGVIPVRMESRRLPGKPLRSICGRPMFAWVYARARSSPLFNRLTVATDSDAILSYCAAQAIPALRTSPEHPSGTSRLLEVLAEEGRRGDVADVFVNIQGDEPMVSVRHIELLLSPFLYAVHSNDSDSGSLSSTGPSDPADQSESSRVQVSTLKVAITPAEAADRNAVKVVTDLGNRALYFSRAPIPCDRDSTGRARCYKHLGFYAYSVQALRRFSSLLSTPLEQTEQLEQLRFLENGIPITVVETNEDTIGVDTEDDLRRVEQYFRSAGIASVDLL